MIRYSPSKTIKELITERRVKRLLTKALTLNKTVLNILASADFIDKKKLETIALKVVKQYKERYKDEIKEGSSKAEALDEAVGDKGLLVSRVQNEVVFQIKEQIKEKYRGERYIWLPSDAEEPDPEHQLNYGKTFVIGEGEMPGDRIGCRCGMQILVKESELEL